VFFSHCNAALFEVQHFVNPESNFDVVLSLEIFRDGGLTKMQQALNQSAPARHYHTSNAAPPTTTRGSTRRIKRAHFWAAPGGIEDRKLEKKSDLNR